MGGSEAQSLHIARSLDAFGIRVVGYDPVVGKKAARLLPELKVVFDPYEAFRGAHVAVVVTEWKKSRTLELKKVADLMK